MTCWERNGLTAPADPTKVPHPGKVNDPWKWLKAVACSLTELGRATEAPMMLNRAYQAHLSGGLAACIEIVGQYLPVEDANG